MKKLMAAVCLPALVLIFMAYACSNEQAEKPQVSDNPFKGQNLLTQAELDKFIIDYPAYVRWAISKGESEPSEQEIESFIQSLNWQVIRFSYVMNQVMVGSMAVRMKDQIPQAKKQIAELQAERDRYLTQETASEEQKKDIAAQFNELIESKQDMLRQIEELPAEELALIKGSMDRLATALASGMPEIADSPESFFTENGTAPGGLKP